MPRVSILVRSFRVVFNTYWKKNLLGCGHCKRSKPEFVKAAAHFKDDIKHEFAAVDCTSDNCKQTCSDNNVDGFPTFVLFKYGQFVQKYHKDRMVSDFFFLIYKKVRKTFWKSGISNVY